jgi:hypothetical protein
MSKRGISTITVKLAAVLAIALASRSASADRICEAGKTTTGDGTCCWPGQISQGGSCAGAPACPAGSRPEGAECVTTAASQTRLAPDPVEARDMDRARFSGKRLVLEILAGEAAGLLTTFLLCNDSSCPGDGWIAFGADFAVTPLAVWGVGTALGGRGSLGYAYLGASPALTPLSMPGSPDESPADTLSRIRTEAMVSALLLPVCSAVLYEATSHFASVRWRTEHAPQLTVRPVIGHDGVTGGVGALSLRF